MRKEVRFFKQDGKWYADIPEHTLEENEMVMGSDTLLEMLSDAGKFDTIRLTFEDEEPDSYMLAFKMTEHDDDGAYYSLSGPLYNIYVDAVRGENNILTTVWICNVTHDVFGEHPKELYLTDIYQHPKMTKEDINKEYDRKQCVYGEDSTMPCMFCSATCRERYEDFTKKGVKIAFI